jgi:N-acetylmuramoyl-L-alanine amidase CwlA
LAAKKTTSASSHYIIGLEGEVLQCIPLTEIAYASNERNSDTIAIECCHMDETGVFNEETYDSLVSLTAALCIEFDLKKKDILRHYDITEKLCPLYFVEHEDAWDLFRAEVMLEVDKIKKNVKQ